ncbi:hypothetical protein Syun_019996 [Stephania yunnanensis]|uniref:Fe2OG dioxygenase domain-containing protein n=1 Tax=Stephania yunnanensis TaxID=152371 RepID=A0AAP0NXV5_9MAGN
MAASKLLLTDFASTLTHIPHNYIRPTSDRPNLSQVDLHRPIPLIDLAPLHDHTHQNRGNLVREIGLACKKYGFFQVKNHGVSDEVIDGMMRISREFFELPESERLKCYSDDPSKAAILLSSFNVNTEKVCNWRDFLRLHCLPLEDYIHDWPTNPPSFREVVGEYSKNVRRLVLDLLELISESLGLDKDYMNKALGRHGQHMGINYYPPCPQPDLTYGLPGHTDPNALTVLLQDDVPGFQVLNNGKWVAVNPIPKTFIVNIGDQIQVLSNDRYKSVLHRAVVNSEKERFSVPTFYCPSYDAVIEPARELVDGGGTAYTSFAYKEFYDKFWKRGLRTDESCLDMFRVNN